MLTYEYRCPNCGDFEVEQRITDDTLTSCPTCGAAMKKLMPRKLFVSFKGPGFHVNDYPSGNRKHDPVPDLPPVSTDSKPAGEDSSAAGAPAKAASTSVT